MVAVNNATTAGPPDMRAQFPDPFWEALSSAARDGWLADISDFPPPPLFVETLGKELSLENYDPQSLAERITGDTILAARILGLANNAAYGLTRPISTIKRALVQLGFNLVRSTILRYQIEASAAHLSGLQAQEIKGIQLAADQGALICYHWCALQQLPDPAAYATLCLLGRLGTFLLARRYPDAMQDYFQLAHEPQRLAFENNHFGITVRSLTLQVASSWKLPDELLLGIYNLWNPLFSEDRDAGRCIACASFSLGYAPPGELDDLLKWLSPRANSKLRDNLLLSGAALRLPAIFDSEVYRREMTVVSDTAAAA